MDALPLKDPFFYNHFVSGPTCGAQDTHCYRYAPKQNHYIFETTMPLERKFPNAAEKWTFETFIHHLKKEMVITLSALVKIVNSAEAWSRLEAPYLLKRIAL